MKLIALIAVCLVASFSAQAADQCLATDPANAPADRSAELLIAPLPAFPDGERSEGFVEVLFDVAADGTVSNPEVAFSILPDSFDAAAVQAVLASRYLPGIQSGEATVQKGVRRRVMFARNNNSRIPDPPPVPSGAVSKHVFEEIKRTQALNDREDFAGARSALEGLLEYPKLTPYERVNVLNFLAFVHFSTDNYDDTIRIYEELLGSPALNYALRKQTLYSLAQLHTMEEHYAEAVESLDRYFSIVPNPPAPTYVLYAQVMYQMEDFPAMIEPMRKAMNLQVLRGEPIKEDWYVLLNFAYFQQESYAKVRDIQRVLLAEWPKDRYRMSLAGALRELGDHEEMLGVLANLYEESPSAKHARLLAINYSRIGRKDESLAMFRKLAERWPDSDHPSELSLAAAAGDTNSMRQLLSNDAKLEIDYEGGSTPLHWAAEFGQLDAITLLIDAGAELEATAGQNLTPLHLAVSRGELEATRLLLAAGANVNVGSDTEMTPLMTAAKDSNLELMTLLIEAGADGTRADDQGLTALHAVSASGKPAVAQVLIDAGALVDATSNTGGRPLHYAAALGNSPMLRLLLKQGADVDAKDTFGRTPIQRAVSSLDIESVRMLIAAGANVNLRSDAGFIPLSQAAYLNNNEIVAALIAAGAIVDAKSASGATALSLAAEHAATPVVRSLIEAGADAMTRNSTGATPMIFAAIRGDVDTLETLKLAGAEIDAKTDSGNTPLYYAAAAGNAEASAWLAAGGANLEVVEDLADLGIPEAIFVLGTLYEKGIGFRQKDSAAAKQYVEAALKGYEPAQTAVVRLHLSGARVKADQEELSKWIAAAASHGDPDAQLRLAEMYRTGKDMEKDTALAAMWSCLSENTAGESSNLQRVSAGDV